MEVVIKIEEELYNTIMCSPNSPTLGWYEIAHGTVLPKGHDRLVEARAVIEALFGKQTIDDVPTIIDADKENDDGTDN